jgi:hypothetical protein
MLRRRASASTVRGQPCDQVPERRLTPVERENTRIGFTGRYPLFRPVSSLAEAALKVTARSGAVRQHAAADYGCATGSVKRELEEVVDPRRERLQLPVDRGEVLLRGAEASSIASTMALSEASGVRRSWLAHATS